MHAAKNMDQRQSEAWQIRNEYWFERGAKPAVRRAMRAQNTQPLILCGHGISLSVDRGTLFIRDGLTHFPQERATYRYFKGDQALPPLILVLDATGSISFDVLAWLSEQNIPLFRLDWAGNIASIIGGNGFSQNHERVLWQLGTRGDPERRLAFCCDLISSKVSASIHTLHNAVPASNSRDIALSRAESTVKRLEARAVRSVDELRMIEAGAAASYFRAWRRAPIRWRSKTRHPVPESWLTVGGRRTAGSGTQTNRHARHPVNAMLNYAYTVMHSQVRAEIAAQGYDPRLGVMHETRSDALAFALDLIEPRRPLVDREVLRFLFANDFSGADFVIRADGVCRLSPQLARRVCEVAARAAGDC